MSHALPYQKTPTGPARVAVASGSDRPLRCKTPRPAPTTPRADEAGARGNLLSHVAAGLICAAGVVGMALL